ncbi:G-protein-coupled receptor family 3 protein 14 [Dictyostelium discoideum AX4]|uniref:Metabotropic glutamate receptor-like protein O n=1 Tax=Dictyostelium discoideum TaxID=44689 RepID=GRLO_DICDI|nr:G-protein-coupled receptor family 3 protein 14 [Dictyostelium discoideum AX4]Q55AP3.1 RecName: Full=Metabotropic glutamate receptor-like protein O; Flags: Precursor [Dictyostelium discoideum]EAL71534.1 G-protein-coupled receptor family 3 protein 14 [Dictyostelium discoideum AX4]|eukprot:XP_645479.1 G-protein-coupled receptor family 3 protein 14 [Dictyostelium discoideum AX4]
MKKVFFLILILNCVVGALSNKNICKISLLLSGDYNDIGVNYMFNYARTQVEKNLNINSIVFTNLENNQNAINNAIIESINKGSNFLISTINSHSNFIINYSRLYKNKEIFWLIKGNDNERPIPDDLPRVKILNINSDLSFYYLGFISSLISKTGKIGFISTKNIETDYQRLTNAFYIGAINSNPNITFLVCSNNFNNQNNNKKISYKISKLLISKGVDFIGSDQDDNSIQLAVIDNGGIGLGLTGFEYSKIYNDKFPFSFKLEWSQLLIDITNTIINGSWVDYDIIYITSFSRLNGTTNFTPEIEPIINYNFIPKIYQKQINDEINKLKNHSTNYYFPHLCNNLFNNIYNQKQTNGCITNEQFSNSHLLNASNIKIIDNKEILEFVDSYSNSIKISILSVSIFCIFICVLGMIFITVLRNARILKSSSPSFLLLILFGCIVIFTGCILFSQPATDKTCQGRVWLLSIGYTIFLGSLLIKNWRVWLLFDNKKLRKRSITNWKLYPWVAGILVVDVLILALWQGLGDIKSESRIIGTSFYQYTNVCTNNDQGSIALYILLAFHGLKLLGTCFISFKIKLVDIEEFNESKPITTSVFIILFCIFTIILLIAPSSSSSSASSPQPIASLETIICICSVTTTAISIGLLFGDKIYFITTQGLGLNQTFAKSSSFSLDKKDCDDDDDDSSDGSDHSNSNKNKNKNKNRNQSEKKKRPNSIKPIGLFSKSKQESVVFNPPSNNDLTNELALPIEGIKEGHGHDSENNDEYEHHEDEDHEYEGEGEDEDHEDEYEVENDIEQEQEQESSNISISTKKNNENEIISDT